VRTGVGEGRLQINSSAIHSKVGSQGFNKKGPDQRAGGGEKVKVGTRGTNG